MDRISPEEAAKELTMLLMYLTRFHEKDRFIDTSDKSHGNSCIDIIF